VTEALGKRLEDVFHIINEETRKHAEQPVRKVIDTGLVRGLANHTVLIARDGSELPIDEVDKVFTVHAHGFTTSRVRLISNSRRRARARIKRVPIVLVHTFSAAETSR